MKRIIMTTWGILVLPVSLCVSVLLRFVRNMARLGVDPAEIDFVVLSHPHADHLGGFQNRFARQAIVQQEHDPLAGKPVYGVIGGLHFPVTDDRAHWPVACAAAAGLAQPTEAAH
jgi:metal-dependent hydrolase (beta-lactamase superfamily II)